MRRAIPFVISGLLFAVTVTAFADGTAVNPPVAEKKLHYTVTHGDSLRDDYFWMREKENPDVKRFLEAENAYVDAVMAPTKPLQETLYKEMLGRIQETDLSVPYKKGGFYYYSRDEQGKQYKIHCRRAGSIDAPEQVILDVNQLGEGLEFISVGDMEVSDDGNYPRLQHGQDRVPPV